MATLRVRVVSPEKVVWEGDAASLTAPAWDGHVGVLPGHAPMISLLGHGELVVDVPKGGSESFYVAGGVLKVEDDGVTALTEYAGDGPPDELPEEAVIHAEDVVAWTAHADPGDPLV